MDADIVERARAWLEADPDPVTRDELGRLLDASDIEELKDRFAAPLEFGTAGLRGVVGAGPGRMNRVVVLRTTRGLADHLLASSPDAAGRGVVVGYDARHDSEVFAEYAVAVLAAAGITVHRFTVAQPTPLVAYAQRVLDAAAAVVVTASHNPPEYNGYKVYAEGAAQIVPPTDTAIAEAIERVGPAKDVPLVDPTTSAHVHALGDEIEQRYLTDIAAARPRVEGPDVRIVYTPLHGVGAELVGRALTDAGYHDVHQVETQRDPDPRFPTVAFPNPEEPGAMDEAIRLAHQVGAGLILANDPDADRLAAAIVENGAVRVLSGNQIGVLLADHLLRNRAVTNPLLVASIVSTPMLRSIGDAYGAHTEYTLTGFKWICAAARALEAERDLEFVYGFEEALGSSVGTVVRDKDGISAAVVFADLVRSLAAQGQSVRDRLVELAARHDLWVSHQHSVTRPGVEGRGEIAAAMATLSHDLPASLAGHDVTATTDYRSGAESRPAWLAEHDLVAFDLADGRAMIRPSGTEPKCKIYVDLHRAVAADVDLDAEEADLAREAADVAVDLARHVGLA